MYLQINCIQSNTMRQPELICLASDFVVQRRIGRLSDEKSILREYITHFN